MRKYPPHIHGYFTLKVVKPSFLLQAKSFFERGPVAFLVVRFTGEGLNMLNAAFRNASQSVGATDNLRLSSDTATAEMKPTVAPFSYLY